MILSLKLEDAVVLFMAGLAENILQREGDNDEKVTRIECVTTVSPDPFTIEVRVSLVRVKRDICCLLAASLSHRAIYDARRKSAPLTGSQRRLYSALRTSFVPCPAVVGWSLFRTAYWKLVPPNY